VTEEAKQALLDAFAFVTLTDIEVGRAPPPRASVPGLVGTTQIITTEVIHVSLRQAILDAGPATN
jgi:hypothetical protein